MIEYTTDEKCSLTRFRDHLLLLKRYSRAFLTSRVHPQHDGHMYIDPFLRKSLQRSQFKTRASVELQF